MNEVKIGHHLDFIPLAHIISRVPTRYLLIASAVVGLAILVAGAIWFLRLYL